MSKHKSSSGDSTVGHGYVNNAERPSNNSKPVFETSHIEREEGKYGESIWSQIWRYRSNGSLYITWDSRIGDITLD